MQRRTATHEKGSASIWVLTAAALLMVIAYAVVLRGVAVLARHRAEAAADLAALAGADQVGRDGGVSAICGAAARIASDNRATVVACRSQLAADGRSGAVVVQIAMPVRLPVLGARRVTATARAARLPADP
jgi:secretion/DNA translocation related TadE-like protein